MIYARLIAEFNYYVCFPSRLNSTKTDKKLRSVNGI